jgi:hypothetical protein
LRLVQSKEEMKIRFKTSIQLRKLVSVILLVCGLLLYGERRVSGAETEGKATIIVFDAPGASTGQFQGTFPTAINPAGAIVGYYYGTVLDQFGNNIPQAFLRAPNGKFTTFDPPGYPNNTLFINTVGNTLAINPAGAITGSYVDANGFVHGFLRVTTGGDERAPKVTFTTFDVPGPPGSPSTGTFASAINPAGAITGYYSDAGGTPHGFLRSPKGTFATFDPPGPLFYQQQIYPQAINPAGAITGYYEDASLVFHGFLRAPDGSFITFDPTPGSQYTVANGINPAGAITGYYTENLYYGPYHSFLRAPNGSVTTFDYPNTNQGIFAYAINPAWTITGNYFANNQYHGFLRARNGKFTSFDPPGSTNTTTALAINPAGEITGYYPDANFVNHGFVRIPAQPDE